MWTVNTENWTVECLFVQNLIEWIHSWVHEILALLWRHFEFNITDYDFISETNFSHFWYCSVWFQNVHSFPSYTQMTTAIVHWTHHLHNRTNTTITFYEAAIFVTRSHNEKIVLDEVNRSDLKWKSNVSYSRGHWSGEVNIELDQDTHKDKEREHKMTFKITFDDILEYKKYSFHIFIELSI